MNQHDGVTCDSCGNSNFCGHRYKCLVCRDYDLCGNCQDKGLVSRRHQVSHPVQCILTRRDIDLFFAGEDFAGVQTLSYTCPLCGALGFSAITLLAHVRRHHVGIQQHVMCPICACTPGSSPTSIINDFLTHMASTHPATVFASDEILEEFTFARQEAGAQGNTNRARGTEPQEEIDFWTGRPSAGGPGRPSVEQITEHLQHYIQMRRGETHRSNPLCQFMIEESANKRYVTKRSQLGAPAETGRPMGSLAYNPHTPGSRQVQIRDLRELEAFQLELQPAYKKKLTVTPIVPVAATVTAIKETPVVKTVTPASESQFLLKKFLKPTLTKAQLAKVAEEKVYRSQFVQALMMSLMSYDTLHFGDEELVTTQQTLATDNGDGNANDIPNDYANVKGNTSAQNFDIEMTLTLEAGSQTLNKAACVVHEDAPEQQRPLFDNSMEE